MILGKRLVAANATFLQVSSTHQAWAMITIIRQTDFNQKMIDNRN